MAKRLIAPDALGIEQGPATRREPDCDEGAGQIVMRGSRQLQTQAVILEMQRTRDELHTLFLPQEQSIKGEGRSVFPRSRTLRWLLSHPLGRWAGSTLLSGALSRLPIWRFVARWVLGNRR